jgi:glutamate/tyrosine decarboxylase-like PLP-dependent enzyme
MAPEDNRSVNPRHNRPSIRFPATGVPRSELRCQMEALRDRDVRWREGKVFGLVYDGGEEVDALVQEAHNLFHAENGLNPMAFPSLRRFETEVVGMALDLLGGGSESCGNMTSGGTESLLMAVKTARDWARVHRPEVRNPEMILPLSAHPGLDKAAHYFGIEIVRTPIGPDLRADLAAVREAISENTVLLVGSAPSYPHGVMDPIVDLAALAQEHGLLCHVDGCMGGFMLPFVGMLGYPVPDFDLSVPGVTSLSADLHKYGYGPKGSSVILYGDRALRRHQFFVTTDWPGGVYASPTMAGSRPGGTIAAAWAVMQFLGREGYLQMADTVMRATARLRDGINAIEGLAIMGDPVMSVLAFGSERMSIYEVGDEMAVRGWHLDRQQFPPSLHMTVSLGQAEMVDAFLDDLSVAVRAAARRTPRHIITALLLRGARSAARVLPPRLISAVTERASTLVGGETAPDRRTAALYGLLGTMPNRGDLKELVLDMVESFTDPVTNR